MHPVSSFKYDRLRRTSCSKYSVNLYCGTRHRIARLPSDGQANIYVTCQTNDDVPYIIVRYAGENRLVIGTDHGHTDPSSAVTALNLASK